MKTVHSTKLSQHTQTGHFGFDSVDKIFNILLPNFV